MRLPPLERTLWTGLTGLVALLLLGPTLPHLGDRLLGRATEDAYGTQWFYSFLERSLVEGGSPLRTDLLYFPWGKDILLHTGANLLDALVALPFRLLFSEVLGTNLFLIAGLLATGLSFFLLARDLTRSRSLALLGSLLVTCSPFVLHELAEGRPMQGLLPLLPLFLRSLLRLCRAPAPREALLGGVLLALIGYQYWYYGLFGGLIVIAAALGGLGRREGRGRALLQPALLLLVAGVLVLPGLLPLMSQLAGDTVAPGRFDLALLFGELRPWSQGGEVLPLHSFQPWWGEVVALRRDGERILLESQVLLLPCWVAVPLTALIALRPGALPKGPFLAALLFALLLSVGPFLALGGTLLPNPLYQALMETGAPLQRLWWPYRAFAFANLLLVLGLVSALDTFPRRVPLYLVTALLMGQGLLLRQAGLLPFPSWDARPPAFARCLANPSSPAGALVDLPFGRSQVHLWYQTIHGRPILGGMQEHRPEFQPQEALSLRRDNRFVAALIAAADTGRFEAGWSEQERAALVGLGYRYVVLHLDTLLPAGAHESMPRWESLERSRRRAANSALEEILGPSVYSDERALLWDLVGEVSPCDGEEPAAGPSPARMTPPTPPGASRSVEGPRWLNSL